MATAPQGGLGALTPVRPPAPAQPPGQQPGQQPNPAQAAQRISGLEQAPEEDYLERALRNRREQEAALNAQIEALKNSLDSRMKPAFDPALMAAAAGFLKPTKTGGFGESLGYAAEGYASESEKELARRQLLDKNKLELAQKQAQLQNQNLMFEHQLQMSGYDPKEATTLKTDLSGAPAGGLPSAGGEPTGGAPAAPRQAREPKQITERDIQIAMAINPEYGKQLMDQAKFQQDRYLSTPQGVIDKRTGKVIETGLESSLETSIPYLGPEKITQSQAAEIKQLNAKFPNPGPEREDAFARYYSMNGIGGVKYTPPAEGKPSSPAGMKTASERESERKAEEKTQELRITEGEKRASGLIESGMTADTLKNIAQDMTAYAESNPRAFQLMQTATLKDSVLRSIEKGGAPLDISPRTILQYKLQDKDIEALQMFAQKSAQLTTQMRRVSRAPGEGATDRKEGELYASVEAMPSDTARVIGLKSELLELRADFDKAAASLWVDWRDQNPGKSFDKFKLSSPEFKQLRSSYDNTLDAVRKANAELLGTGKPATKPASPPANQPQTGQPSAARSNERVIGGTIWVRDEKGAWNDTGRKPK
jgi:hypothetical protein